MDKMGWKYPVRLKKRHRTYAYGITLPNQPEFDFYVRLTLGRLTQRRLKLRGIRIPEVYYRLASKVTFDYREPDSTEFLCFPQEFCVSD